MMGSVFEWDDKEYDPRDWDREQEAPREPAGLELAAELAFVHTKLFRLQSRLEALERSTETALKALAEPAPWWDIEGPITRASAWLLVLAAAVTAVLGMDWLLRWAGL